MPLGDLGDSVSYSIFEEVSDLAASGRKVFPLAIGEPSFSTPREIIETAHRSLKEGNTHYVSSLGIPDIRTAIVQKVAKRNRIDASDGEVIFMTTKLAVYASILATCGGQGEVLIPDPGYFYSQPVRLAGSRPVYYRLAPDYSLDLGDLEKVATSKTRAIIVNTPSNPTGKMLAKGELQELLQFCQKRGIAVVSDESYEDLVYGKEHISIGSLEGSPENVVSLFSLSKSFAMTGWRAGYAVASKPMVRLLNRFVEHTMSCFPPFIEAASAYALTKGEKHTRQFRAELLKRRGLLERGMRRSSRLNFQRTEGAFYSFPNYDAKLGDVRFCRTLLRETGVAVLPGSIFGPAGKGHLRISFAAPGATINEGTRRLTGFLEKLPR